MNITVYSKSGCPECVFTKKFLESENMLFEEKRVDLNETHLNEVVDLGYQSLPVVKYGEESFNGYQPERLEQMAEQWRA